MSQKLAPTPHAIQTARRAAKLSQAEAAALVGATRRTWQNWESPVGSANHRAMPAATWERFEAMCARAVAAWSACLTPAAILGSVPAEWRANFKED